MPNKYIRPIAILHTNYFSVFAFKQNGFGFLHEYNIVYLLPMLPIHIIIVFIKHFTISMHKSKFERAVSEFLALNT